jgi:hypothetical protein
MRTGTGPRPADARLGYRAWQRDRLRPIAVISDNRQNRLMRWHYRYSWALFFVGCAVLAFAVQGEWPQRIILFLVMTVPITAWARSRIRKGT